MQRFIINSLSDWNPMSPTNVVQFSVEGKARTVRFTVNASERVSIFAATDEEFSDEVLVAVGDGLLDIELTASADVYVRYESEAPGVSLFMRTLAASHFVEAKSFDVFTQPMVRRSRNPEVERLMQVMRLNERDRELRMQAEVARLRQELTGSGAAAARRAEGLQAEAEVIEPGPAPETSEAGQ